MLIAVGEHCESQEASVYTRTARLCDVPTWVVFTLVSIDAQPAKAIAKKVAPMRSVRELNMAKLAEDKRTAKTYSFGDACPGNSSAIPHEAVLVAIVAWHLGVRLKQVPVSS